MDGHLERHTRDLNVQEGLAHDEMPGAGYGKEFRDSLDEAEEKGVQKAHRPRLRACLMPRLRSSFIPEVPIHHVPV